MLFFLLIKFRKGTKTKLPKAPHQTVGDESMKANINFKNAEEFQKLLERAATLSVQLQETLQQINNFEPKIEIEK